jgi:hypothetical protein
VGLDFCASSSVRLMLGFCSATRSNLTSYCPVCFGGLVSLTWGMPPAMEVSGMPVFRGGGGWGSKELGWYAVLVCIFRFEDIWEECAEEKVLERWWQGFINLRTKPGDEVIGATTRWRLIFV